MNALVIITETGTPVTNTLAIAEGTGNDHASVIKLVRTYQTDLEEFGGVGFEIRPFETPGGAQKREVAILNEQQSTLLLTYMRNSDIVRKFKKALVKAFFEMAGKMQQPAVALPNFTDPAEAAIAWAAEFKAKQLALSQVVYLEAENQSMKDDVKALGLIAKAENSLCLTDAAKVLGMPRNKLIKYLSLKNWIFRRHGGGVWLGYSDKEKQGLVELKLNNYEAKDGSIKVSEQVRITPKGMVKLAKMLAEGEVA